jgi:hypothetical protein
MNAARTEAILNYADAIRKHVDLDGYPLDMEEFIIRFLPDVEKSFIIDPRRFHEETFNRYNIAMMLGHLLLHTDYMKEKSLKSEYRADVFKGGFAYHEQKIEADLFAQSLLMPRDVFREVVEKHFIKEYCLYHVGNIGAHFGVPPRIVRTYGRWIATFKWNDF